MGTVLKTKRGRRKGREKKRGKGEVMKRSREKGMRDGMGERTEGERERNREGMGEVRVRYMNNKE